MGEKQSIFSSISILILAVAAITACILTNSASAVAGDPHIASSNSTATAVANTGILRVASVSTAVEGNLLPSPVMSFEKETGIKTLLTRDDDPYETAGKGGYDIVISHFGHRDVEKFVQNGLGLWPKTVFSNQLVLAGPASDPAHIRGATSLVEAFRRIARAKAPPTF